VATHNIGAEALTTRQWRGGQ